MKPRTDSIIKFLIAIIIIFALRATITLVIIDDRSDLNKDARKAISYEDIINKQSSPEVSEPPEEMGLNNSRFINISYQTALIRVASKDKVVIIALIDWGFMDMALNFYETSLFPYGIENYLFLASDEKSCSFLGKLGISCYVYAVDEAGNKASEYQSKSFLRKMNYRTDMIIKGLEAGFTILHTDIDIMYLKNPLDHIHCTSETNCDIMSLWDATKFNAGFIYLRPTKPAIALYKNMKSIRIKNPKMDDQIQLLHAVESMKRRNLPLNITKLPEDTFQCGRCYFEDGKRHFAGENPCEDCVVVHNNWIVTKEAKRYRARENHHWLHDWGQYYSSTTAKYILYDSPQSDCTVYWYEEEQLEKELKALRNAMVFGYILGRIVILPSFQCGNSQCALNTFVKIRDFDHAFENGYREHSFLWHPKVPDSIKNGTSKIPYFIRNNHRSSLVRDWCIKTMETSTNIIESSNNQIGLTDAEIKEHFGDIKDPVLHFRSMQDTFSGFIRSSDQKCFDKLAAQAFTRTDYRQQKPPPKP